MTHLLLAGALLFGGGPGLTLREPECLVSVAPSPATTGLALPATSDAALQTRWLKVLHREMAGGHVPKPGATPAPKKPKWTEMLKKQLQSHGSLRLSPSLTASPK